MEKEQFALRVMDLYPEDVRLVYHHYPSTEYSYVLDELLEFASRKGEFWVLHDRLLEGVPGDEIELEALVSSMNFDRDEVREALENYVYRGVVEQAKAEAEARGVTDTGLFINGKEYQGYPGTFEEFRAEIEAAIKSAKGDD